MGENVQFVYIGHGAEKTIFKDYKQEKTIDILYVGFAHNQYYPLRCRFINMFWDFDTKTRWIPTRKKKNSIISDKYTIALHYPPGYEHADSFTNKYAIEYA